MKKSVFLLACLMLLSVFVGCKKDDANNGPNEGGTPPPVQSSILDELPTMDMGGREFTLLTLNDYNDRGYFVSEAYTGEVLWDQAFERTAYVENKYNIDLKILEEAQCDQLLKQDYLGGTKLYDLMYPHPTAHIVGEMIEGYFTDLNSLSELTLSGAWYNQSQVQNYTSANGKLYVAVSDFSLAGQGMGTTVYNKALYTSGGHEANLYDMVRNGTWTQEAMMNIVKQYDSVGSDSEAPTYGLIFHRATLDSWPRAWGARILEKNADGGFALYSNNTRMSDFATTMFGIYYNTPGILTGSSNDADFPTSEMYLTFQEGRGLFITMDVRMTDLMSQLSFDFGVVPPPLYEVDETPEYQTFCGAGFFAIPARAKSVSESAVIFEALSRYSYEVVRPQYFEAVLLGRCSNESDDYQMLELIHASKFYDFGFTLDDSNNARSLLVNMIHTSESTNVTGYMRKYKSDFDAILELANSMP